MKKIYSIIAAIGLVATTSCDTYLDVNANPNGPEKVGPNLYLSPIQSGMALGVQWDARYLSRYVQNFVTTSTAAFNGVEYERQGAFGLGTDNSGELWKSVYWVMGMNAVDLIKLSEEQQRWDLAGVGQVCQAWGWQMLTDYSSEIILTEAFDPSKKVFNYDSQEDVYKKVVELCNAAIVNLSKTEGAVSQSYFGPNDLIYGGDREKWKKFAYALLAINAQHLSNKTGVYNADKVIEYVDKAFVDSKDDALVRYNGSVSGDSNFFGPTRDNITNYRQSKFIADLMNGTTFTGVTDPRIATMLAPAPDGVYRGLLPAQLWSGLATAQRPNNLWGTVTRDVANLPKGKYIFADGAKFPLITFAQLQFIKAEAAWIKGDKGMALAAFRKGVEAHIDFVNSTPNATQITSAAKTAYISSAAVPADAASLTLNHIMLQKYIAQFGWGFIEQWCDLRRYHYDANVFTGFQVPTGAFLHPDNGGKLAYRVRPRYNSEYMWNIEALTKIGGMNPDYHTYEMWFSKSSNQ